jgi:hypothetical protein
MNLEAMIALPRAELKLCLGWPEYQLLLGHPGWSFFLQFIDRTREYERGLDIGFELLELTETYRPQMTSTVYTRCLTDIYRLILRMLDKTDRWEEYIQAHDRLFNETRLPLGGYYADASRPRHLHHGIGPYILEDVPGGFRVHFLWAVKHRRDVIARKLARKQAGNKLGALYHATPEQLDARVLHTRIEQLLKFIRAAYAHRRT